MSANAVMLKEAVSATSPEQIKKYLPIVLGMLNKTQPNELTETDIRLVEQFYNKAHKLSSKNTEKVAQQAVKFQELSHQQIIDTFSRLDMSKLDASGTAKVADTSIKENHKTSRTNTIVMGIVSTVGMAILGSVFKTSSDNDYKLKRPRSLSEKVFGDKE